MLIVNLRSPECFAPTEFILAADFTRTQESFCCHCEAARKPVNMHGESVKSAVGDSLPEG
ncbi:MAG: hypothetical protein F6K35_42315 [Okeania sp. SIO2H7]|nr:hypothetical protein [Okeania sp. SIO2H7]